MNYKQPHIEIIKKPNGDITMEIDDTELFDFIEDYLIEKCSIEYAYLSETLNHNKIMHFTDKYSFNTLIEAIQKLDRDEIEKIYQLNN
ncbi:MAG: hypothetical protein R2799_04870 [Crocinitomicaceae bacterium]